MGALGICGRRGCAVIFAVLVAVAACSSGTPNSVSTTESKQHPFVQLDCVPAAGGSVAADVPALRARARAVNARAKIFVYHDQVTVQLPGKQPAMFSALCDRGLLEFRPVVVAPEAVSCGTSCVPDAVRRAARAGSFAVPSSAAAAARLSASQQSKLRRALAMTDCAAAAKQSPASSADAVACSRRSGGASALAYLLGPVIVSGSGIKSASARAPGTSGGNPTWTVLVQLTSAAQQAWTSYTTAHNTGNNTTAAGVTTCSRTSTPCADYVGFVLDGVVISAPVNLSPIHGPTQISASFTAASARRLASQLSGGPLPVPLTVAGIGHGH